MTSKLLSHVLRAAAILLVLLVVAVLVASLLLENVSHYARRALQHFEDETGYHITFVDISTHFERGVGLRIDDFTLSHTATGRELLSGGHLYVRLNLRSLLKKKITVEQLQIDAPVIDIYRNADGTWQSFLSAVMLPDSEAPDVGLGLYDISVRNFSLRNGSLTIRDELNDTALRLDACDIALYHAFDHTFRMKFTARHFLNGNRGTISCISEFNRSLFTRRGPDEGLETLLTAALDFDNVPFRQCLSYLPDRFAVPLTGGLLDGSFDLVLKSGRTVLVSGDLMLRDARAVAASMEPVSLPETHFSFKAASDSDSIRCDEFSIRMIPDISLSGSAIVRGLDTDAPAVAVQAASGRLDVQEIGARIVASDPQRLDWLAQALERISAQEIVVHELHAAVPLGAAFALDALSLHARLGIDGFRYIPEQPVQVPALSDGTVELALEHGRLQARGSFGLLPGDSHSFDAELRLPGGTPQLSGTFFSRLPPAGFSSLIDMLLRDSDRPAPVRMHQGSLAAHTSFRYDGSLYISADIDATAAAYSLAGMIGKPAGVANTLRFDYEHSATAVTPVRFNFLLGKRMSVNGRLLPEEGFAVEGAFAAVDFNLNALTFEFLPRPLWLCGSVSGAGDFVFPARDPDLRSVIGTLEFIDAALLTQSGVQPLARLDAVFDFLSPEDPLRVSAGRFEYGQTRGAFSGDLHRVLPPSGSLRIPLDFLAADDFIDTVFVIMDSFAGWNEAPATPAARTGKSGGFFAGIDIEVDLSTSETTFFDWHFGSGTSAFSIRNRQMFWDAIEIEGGGGTVHGSILYDLSHPDHYRLEFAVDRSDVEVFWAIPVLHEYQTVTGIMNLKSRFSTEFKRAREVLPSMVGTFDFVVTDGVIRRLTLLSNIFNMLNVAQLLTFNLPEISADGMPFDTMSGRFFLKDMTLSTDNFLLHCPSIDLSAAGTYNMERDRLDLIIGVQVFRTVARILGSVPYFGRKLTGDGKTLTFTYFKARGSFEKPKITLIPMKAIDNAILKIFQSVREVPRDLMDMPLGMIRRFIFHEEESDTEN